VPVATRREELAEAATDYALEHGLIGLSLRPLAHALGTSDRMLLYHFGDKDDLVATILRTTVARSAQGIRELPASRDLRSAVLELWRAVTTGPQERCQRLYVEAAALGLFGREPYATTVRETNAEWVAAVSSHFERAGLHKAAARQATVLVDAAFMGLQLDEPLDSEPQLRRTVKDLADAVVARWGTPSETRRTSAPQRKNPGKA
jgi:AcrR family transcriptional regulator